jgi:peptidoglycan/LPS O-acetylase OafA/YrhL
MSYSLYLTHVPIGGRIVNLSRRYIDGTGFEILLSLGALGVSLTFAFVFMKLIERPAVELARRYAAHCG